MNSTNIINISNEAIARLQQHYDFMLDAAADVCREAIGDAFKELWAARAKVQVLEAEIETWCSRLTRVTQDEATEAKLAELGFEIVAA